MSQPYGQQCGVTVLGQGAWCGDDVPAQRGPRGQAGGLQWPSEHSCPKASCVARVGLWRLSSDVPEPMLPAGSSEIMGGRDAGATGQDT